MDFMLTVVTFLVLDFPDWNLPGVGLLIVLKKGDLLLELFLLTTVLKMEVWWLSFGNLVPVAGFIPFLFLGEGFYDYDLKDV